MLCRERGKKKPLKAPKKKGGYIDEFDLEFRMNQQGDAKKLKEFRFP